MTGLGNVLITSAGSRVSLLRAFRDELRRIHPGGLVLAADVSPELSAAAAIADGRHAVPPASDPSYVDALLTICRATGVTLVVPTIDTELQVLADNRHRFAAEGVTVAVSDPRFVESCRDKRRTAELLASYGVPSPASVDPADPDFPLFVKPYDGSLSVGATVVRTADDLARHVDDPRAMFAEYLDPADHVEYTVDLYYDGSHRLRCAVPRRRITVRAGEVHKAQTSRCHVHRFITSRLAHLDGARGCLTLQVFHNPATDRVTAIEINPRFGGGYPLSYRAGANFPRWLLQEVMGFGSSPQGDGPSDEWTDGLLMLRYDAEVIVGASSR